MSWSPKSGTVVRSSFGMYSVPVLGAVLYSLLGVDTSNFGSFLPDRRRRLQDMGQRLRHGGNPFALPWTACPTSCPGYRRANQWDLKDPERDPVERRLRAERRFQHRSFKASYVGSYTYDLIYSPDLNQIPANTSGLLAVSRPANGANFPNFREVLTRANGPRTSTMP